jgi:phosphatidylglycerol:prolipoprotein diacylglycerol transferase
MYPTISDFFQDFFGFRIPLPIQTFGFFVALSVIAAAYFLGLELRRRESLGLVKTATQKIVKGAAITTSDIVLSALIGFVIGFKLLFIALNYSSFLDNPQNYILSMDGNLIGGIAGSLLSVFLKYKEINKEKLPEPVLVEETVHPYQLVGNMAMIAAFSGLVGAKIFHNLENIDEFMADPVGALVSFSGLTFYGGLIFGAVCVIYYAKKNGIPALQIIDATAPSLMLAYGLGRMGCQLAGDGDWGIQNTAPKPDWISFLPDWVWAFRYPHNVINEGIPIPNCLGKHCMQLPVPVFPTPLYEVIAGILLFFVLWGIRKKLTAKPGTLFSVYLLLNGVERLLIEQIRVNTKYHISGRQITQAEIIAVVLIVLGGIGTFYFNSFYTKKTTA